MGAVDIGVGHDDDPVVAQLLAVKIAAGAAAERQDQVVQFLVGAHLVRRRARHVQDLAAQGQHRLGRPVACLFGGTASRIAFDQEDFRVFARPRRTIGQFAGQAQARGGVGAFSVALGLAARPVLGLFDHMVDQPPRARRVAGQEMVEMVAHRLLDQAGGFRHAEPFLGLALELRVRDKGGHHHAGAVHDIVAGNLPGLADVGEFGMAAQALDQRSAEALFVAAALGRRHRIDVGVHETFFVRRPGHRPFDPAGAVERRSADEGAAGVACALAERFVEIVENSAGETDGLFFRHAALGRQDFRRAAPADLDAGDQIGLGPRHAIECCRPEGRAVAEDFRVRVEADRRAAPVVARAGRFQLAARRAARIALGPQLPVARHFDAQVVGQRVHHREADAVQAAGRDIGLSAELAAGVQGRENDFQRGLVPELRMRIDRDAAAVVADGDEVVRVQHHLDPARMAGDHLVHRVVDDLGRQMMQRAFVGAADIHARPLADRLQPFEDFDILRGIGQFADRLSNRFLGRLLGRFLGGRAARPRLGPGRLRRVGEQVMHSGHALALARLFRSRQ